AHARPLQRHPDARRRPRRPRADGRHPRTEGAEVTTTASAIRIRSLTKRYGSRTALHGIDLDVPAGTIYGMIGPNGAGKTTTMRILLDLVRPTAGELSVLGAHPRTGGADLRRRIGYLPGELRL